MGDEHEGQVQLGLQTHQQPQDPLGHQLIERTGHLVADDELRLGGQRAGDANALLLTAGKLAGFAVKEGAVKIDQIHQFLHPRPKHPALAARELAHRAGQNLADIVARVQRGIRRLIDHLDIAQRLGPAFGQSRFQRRVVPEKLPRGGGQQPRDHPRESGFPRPAFPHHRRGLAARKGEVEIIQHGHRPIGRRNPLAADQRRSLPRLSVGAAKRPHGPERAGVFLLRSVQHGLGRCGLDRLTILHHADAVGHLADHRQIMRDVDRRRVILLYNVANGA